MRILVADDERDTVLTLMTLLEEVTRCAGFTAARRCRSGSDRILAELVGFDHLVAKPYDIGTLLKLLAD